MFVEYNNMSLIGANCKKLHKNIILILPNDKMLDLNLSNINISIKNVFRE